MTILPLVRFLTLFHVASRALRWARTMDIAQE